MNTPERIQAIASMIDELCQHGHSIEVNLRRYAHPDGDVVIAIHGVQDYRQATEVCRIFGVGHREKSTYDDGPGGRTVLEGKIAPTITLMVFSEGLPPSCRIEKTVERVPKTATVESGEYIEIERTRVVCGQAQDPDTMHAATDAVAMLEGKSAA